MRNREPVAGPRPGPGRCLPWPQSAASAWSTSPSGLASEQLLNENTTHDGNLGQAGWRVVSRATELLGGLGGWHDARVTATRIEKLVTPALLVDADALEHNLSTMGTALPGPRLRPHVKAHKCTALARRQLAAGHHTFTCATIREVEGMAAAGLGGDILLAHEGRDASRLGRLDAPVTVAVDSLPTIQAAATVRLQTPLTHVNVRSPPAASAPHITRAP